MKFYPRRRIRPNVPPKAHAVYHIVSRVVDRRHIFGPEEKHTFLSYVRRYEKFCRVRIIGYCVMDNHFHLLVRVPGRPENRPNQQVLMDHVKTTLGQTIATLYQERIDFWEQQLQIGTERTTSANGQILSPHQPKHSEELTPEEIAIFGENVDLVDLAQQQLEKVSQDIWQRMYDVSQYVFSLKQQFSHWYNKNNDRVGTLWEERFRATLVQEGPAMAEVAAYMDFNPVRVGLVENAKDYPWSQYGAAANGDGLALEGVAFLSEHQPWLRLGNADSRRGQQPWVPSTGLQMGLLLMELLLERRGNNAKDRDTHPGAEPRLTGPDPLPSANYTTGSIRSFTRGVALGDPVYLEKILTDHRDQFGRRRRSAARSIRLPELPSSESEEIRDKTDVSATTRAPGRKLQVCSLLKALRDVKSPTKKSPLA